MKKIQKKQRSHKTLFTNLKSHIKNNYKSFYPMMFSYLFLFLILFSAITFVSLSQLGSLGKYEHFLINDLKPTFQSTGEVSNSQMQQFGSFIGELNGSLISISLILFIGLIIYSLLKSTKDLILWNQIHGKKLFSKKTFPKKLFFKFSLVNLVSSTIFWAGALALLFLMAKPVLVLSLITLGLFLFDFVNLFYQAKFQKKYIDLKSSLRLLLYTLTSFLLILISWWILLLVGSILFFWSDIVYAIFVVILIFFLFSKRELLLFLFADYIFQKRSKK